MQTKSKIEAIALKQSGFKLRYEPVEKIGVIQVNNFPLLGKLAALRFRYQPAKPRNISSKKSIVF